MQAKKKQNKYDNWLVHRDHSLSCYTSMASDSVEMTWCPCWHTVGQSCSSLWNLNGFPPTAHWHWQGLWKMFLHVAESQAPVVRPILMRFKESILNTWSLRWRLMTLRTSKSDWWWLDLSRGQKVKAVRVVPASAKEPLDDLSVFLFILRWMNSIMSFLHG